MIFVYLSQISATQACVYNYAVFSPTNISDSRCDILELKGDNYKVWKEINYAIRKDEP